MMQWLFTFSLATEIENQFDSLAAGRPTGNVEELITSFIKVS